MKVMEPLEFEMKSLQIPHILTFSQNLLAKTKLNTLVLQNTDKKRCEGKAFQKPENVSTFFIQAMIAA